MQTKTFLFQIPVLAAVHPSPEFPENNARELLESMFRGAFQAASRSKMSHMSRDNCAGDCDFCKYQDGSMELAQSLEASIQYVESK